MGSQKADGEEELPEEEEDDVDDYDCEDFDECFEEGGEEEEPEGDE